MLGVPRYRPGENTWLPPNPNLGEGNGVEPAVPITGPVKYAVAPRGVLSPLILPPPLVGERSESSARSPSH